MRRHLCYRALPRSPPSCFEDWMLEPTPQVIPMSARSTRPRALWVMALVAVCALALLGSRGACAQTLTEALSYTYNTNPQLLAQRAVLRQTDESVPQALSNWRPTVTFTGEAGTNRGSLNEGSGDTFSTFQTKEL